VLFLIGSDSQRRGIAVVIADCGTADKEMRTRIADGGHYCSAWIAWFARFK
jgi:hypothetical protein